MSGEWIGLSGAPLVAGGRLVRVVYIDEAGVAKEPHMVEAGVIVNPDQHIPEIEDRMAAIRRDLCPHVPESSTFHATDIWHGSRAFSRDRLDLTTRMEIMQRLASIPAEMGLPIVADAVLRDAAPPSFMSRQDVANAENVLAFAGCVFSAEMWLRQHSKNEVAMIIHEAADMGVGFKNVLRLFQDHALSEAANMPAFFPLRRISRDVLFMEKRGHGPMQLADVAAFLIRRKLGGKTDSQPQFSVLEPQIVPHWNPVT